MTALDRATVRVNGGPPVDLAAAVRTIKGVMARRRAAADPMQTDLEAATGAAPEQEEREAVAGGIAADRLRSIIERVERLEEERKALGNDIKDIYAEAKSGGFDVKVVRQVIALRRKEPAEVEEQETLLDLYRRALGM